MTSYKDQKLLLSLFTKINFLSFFFDDVATIYSCNCGLAKQGCLMFRLLVKFRNYRFLFPKVTVNRTATQGVQMLSDSSSILSTSVRLPAMSSYLWLAWQRHRRAMGSLRYVKAARTPYWNGNHRWLSVKIFSMVQYLWNGCYGRRTFHEIRLFSRISDGFLQLQRYVGGGCCNVGTPSPPASTETRPKSDLSKYLCSVTFTAFAQLFWNIAHTTTNDEHTRLREIWVYHILQQTSWLISKNSDSKSKNYVWPNTLYCFTYLSMNTSSSHWRKYWKRTINWLMYMYIQVYLLYDINVLHVLLRHTSATEISPQSFQLFSQSPNYYIPSNLFHTTPLIRVCFISGSHPIFVATFRRWQPTECPAIRQAYYGVKLKRLSNIMKFFDKCISL